MQELLTPVLKVHQLDPHRPDSLGDDFTALLRSEAVFIHADSVGLVLSVANSDEGYLNLIRQIRNALRDANITLSVFISLLDEHSSVPDWKELFTDQEVVIVEQSSPVSRLCRHEPIFLPENIWQVDCLINIGYHNRETSGVHPGILPNMKHVVPGYYRNRFDYIENNNSLTARRLIDLWAHLPATWSIAYEPVTSTESIGEVVMGSDPLYLDSFIASRCGVSTGSALFKAASEAGIGIRWHNEGVFEEAYLQRSYRFAIPEKKKRIWRIFNKPEINKDSSPVLFSAIKCENCDICCSICPTHALRRSQGSVNIEYNKELCVQCLCCLGHCPAGALTD